MRNPCGIYTSIKIPADNITMEQNQQCFLVLSFVALLILVTAVFMSGWIPTDTLPFKILETGVNSNRGITMSTPVHQTATAEFKHRGPRPEWYNGTAADSIRNLTSYLFEPCGHFLPYSYPAKTIATLNTKEDCGRITPVGHYWTCAIVGNGGILLHSGCGNEIDRNDFVIRMADSPLRKFEKDVGKKVNLTVVNRMFLNKMPMGKRTMNWYSQWLVTRNNSIVSNVLSGSELLKNLTAEVKNLHLNITITYSVYRTRHQVKSFWNETLMTFLPMPSTGLITYSLASTFCDVITLYGFYPFKKDVHKKRVRYHYYDKGRKGKHHDFRSEHRILKSLHNSGVIKMVTDFCK
ncbi:alpha-2,8-sialyltransferase 8B-like [Branchiostoma lanceolatum]|uniref:alpha-2,8-sialyltransferase 8B-like n=1 Tax=Branchiostoma lanceolatum TaxID=7740 RepID=UPI0034565A66